MQNYGLGISGYQPSDHSQNRPLHRQPAVEPKEKAPQKPKTPRPFWQRIRNIAIALLAVAFFLLWLFLGPFRFMLWRAPSFTGFPFGTRTYLVLFQNNYELRPTGGFISSYGELTFSHGLFTGMEFHDVYAKIDDHPYQEPPLVMGTLLEDSNYTGYSFRDANFDPDFRLTQTELTEMYQLTNPDARIDGVLAVDFTFLERWVGLFEPVSVEGQSLTEDNLFETLSSLASDVDRHNEEALATRKNITSPLIKKLLIKTLIFPWRTHAFLELLAQGFTEKHVLATFTRSGLASSFRDRNWDGALPQSDMGDFLVVNEGNYGGMKSDRYLMRDVQYELEVTDQKDILGNPVVKATVSITLSHEGGNNIPLSGPYKGYLRVLLPRGSQILQGSDITEDREDSEVLGQIVQLAPGESVTYTYSYELPEYVWSNDTYYLHLHKQPGTLGDHYRVIVHVPEGMSLTAPGMDVRENVAFLDTPLLTDLNLNFSLIEDTKPPRIVSNEMTALNQITLIFNEFLSSQEAGDPLNYQVVDLDTTNAGTTDEVTVSSVRVDGNIVILTTTGMTAQDEEFYSVIFRGLSDQKGNAQTPNPRTVTVVQRNLAAALEEPLETEVLEEEPSSEL